jgi:hypothetical protein
MSRGQRNGFPRPLSYLNEKVAAPVKKTELATGEKLAA